jgi:hypothetical protein
MAKAFRGNCYGSSGEKLIDQRGALATAAPNAFLFVVISQLQPLRAN